MDSQDLALSLLLILFYFAIIVFYLYCYWRVFARANQPGWTSIVPVLNTYIQLVIIGRPWGRLVLLFVPFVNFVVGIIVMPELGYAFGRSSAFGIGLIFLPFIFVPIPAFGDSPYLGSLGHAA